MTFKEVENFLQFVSKEGSTKVMKTLMDKLPRIVRLKLYFRKYNYLFLTIRTIHKQGSFCKHLLPKLKGTVENVERFGKVGRKFGQSDPIGLNFSHAYFG